MTDTDKLTTRQVSESAGLDDWRVLLRTLQTSFKTGSMAKGMELATRDRRSRRRGEPPPRPHDHLSRASTSF